MWSKAKFLPRLILEKSIKELSNYNSTGAVLLRPITILLHICVTTVEWLGYDRIIYTDAAGPI